jgi:hypothetical protein
MAAQIDFWGDIGPAKGLMSRIKGQLDPQDILPLLQFGL